MLYQAWARRMRAVARRKHGNFYTDSSKMHCFGCWLMSSNFLCIISSSDNAGTVSPKTVTCDYVAQENLSDKMTTLSDKKRLHSSMFGDVTNQCYAVMKPKRRVCCMSETLF